jgi:hypothetical protein
MRNEDAMKVLQNMKQYCPQGFEEHSDKEMEESLHLHQ